MKLHVCYGTFKVPRPGGHPCANAYEALREAGHDPEVVRAFGFGALPDAVNGPRRAEVKRLTGRSWVPVLVLDDGSAITESKDIVAWARAHPGGGARTPPGATSRRPKGGEAAVERAGDDGRQRQQDDEAEPEDRDAERQPSGGAGGGPSGHGPPRGVRTATLTTPSTRAGTAAGLEPVQRCRDHRGGVGPLRVDARNNGLRRAAEHEDEPLAADVAAWARAARGRVPAPGGRDMLGFALVLYAVAGTSAAAGRSRAAGGA